MHFGIIRRVGTKYYVKGDYNRRTLWTVAAVRSVLSLRENSSLGEPGIMLAIKKIHVIILMVLGWSFYVDKNGVIGRNNEKEKFQNKNVICYKFFFVHHLFFNLFYADPSIV